MLEIDFLAPPTARLINIEGRGLADHTFQINYEGGGSQFARLAAKFVAAVDHDAAHNASWGCVEGGFCLLSEGVASNAVARSRVRLSATRRTTRRLAVSKLVSVCSRKGLWATRWLAQGFAVPLLWSIFSWRFGLRYKVAHECACDFGSHLGSAWRCRHAVRKARVHNCNGLTNIAQRIRDRKGFHMRFSA